MTTAEGRFTAQPTILPAGVPVTFDGIRISADPDDPTKPIAEQTGYWEETFTSVRVLPGAVLDTISGSVTIANGAISSINQAQALPILRRLLDDESKQRFERLIHDDDRAVDIGTLWSSAMYLVNKLSGRPTGGSGT